MTEKIAWFEEVLKLEPNSKLFFPLAQAYGQENRHDDAVQVLRRGLTYHPEHLEARLLLIECLAEQGHAKAGLRSAQQEQIQDQDQGQDQDQIPPEVASLGASLSAHPTFWKQWAMHSRAQGLGDMALTLDMLALLFSGSPLSWGTILDRGLRAEFSPTAAGSPSQRDSPVGGNAPATVAAAEPLPTSTNDESSGAHEQASLPESHIPSDEDLPADEISEVADLTQSASADQEPPEPDSKASDSEAPLEAIRADAPKPESTGTARQAATDAPTSLSEGEQRYYETKTYADLLAEQGENEEALKVYTKLLQSSPDELQRQELQSRIQELNDHITTVSKDDVADRGAQQETKKTSEKDPGSSPPDSEGQTESAPAASAPRKSKNTATAKTLARLADRLESRAGG